MDDEKAFFPLKTDRLTIRPLRGEDWREMQKIFADFAQSEYAIYDFPLPTDDRGAEALTGYYLQYLEEAKGVTVGKIFTRLYNAEYWPDSTVQYMIDILDRALESIKPLEETDYERYVVLRDRIKREKLTPIYLMFSLHMSSLTQEEKEVYFADMEKYAEQFGIVETAESVWDMTTQIETWRDEIFG